MSWIGIGTGILQGWRDNHMREQTKILKQIAENKTSQNNTANKPKTNVYLTEEEYENLKTQIENKGRKPGSIKRFFYCIIRWTLYLFLFMFFMAILKEVIN